MARDRLHDAVMAWAEEHWEELVPQIQQQSSEISQLAEQRATVIRMAPHTKLLT